MEQKGTNRQRMLALSILSLVVVVLAYNALFSFSYSVGPNYRNVSIDTRVNITNSKPEVLGVLIENPITLNAGGSHIVSCNATIRDYNGADTISNVTAIFWNNASIPQASPDDGNNHYTNASCTQNVSDGLYTANFTCNFSVLYFADAGSDWVCNVTATDSYAFNASVGSSNSNSNLTTINQLLALNVTSLVDYGNMAVGDTSGPEEANVTNFGNQNINVSVLGYGNKSGDGLAFVCQIGNITIANEKFSLNQTDPYANYVPLSTTYQMIGGLTLLQQTNDAVPVVNSTYWRLYVPPNPFGQCNGTIVFQAESS